MKLEHHFQKLQHSKWNHQGTWIFDHLKNGPGGSRNSSDFGTAHIQGRPTCWSRLAWVMALNAWIVITCALSLPSSLQVKGTLCIIMLNSPVWEAVRSRNASESVHSESPLTELLWEYWIEKMEMAEDLILTLGLWHGVAQPSVVWESIRVWCICSVQTGKQCAQLCTKACTKEYTQDYTRLWSRGCTVMQGVSR